MLRQLIAAIVILAAAATAAYYYWPQEREVCQICRRPMHDATSYFVTLGNDHEVELCCPRCGLRFQTGRNDVAETEVADYPSGQRIAASEAFYVVGSSVHPCCSEADILKDRSGIEYERTWDRCLPSVIAFRSEEDAGNFRDRHGGRILNYGEFVRLETSG